MARTVTHCPNCGASVSQFAAGCAICGEDLVAARTRKEERYARLPSVRLPSLFDEVTGPQAILGAILVVISFFLPVIGVLISGFVAFMAHRSHEHVQRNLALIAVGVLMMTSVAKIPFDDLTEAVPAFASSVSLSSTCDAWHAARQRGAPSGLGMGIASGPVSHMSGALP